MTTRELRNAAADLIEKVGLWKGPAVQQDGDCQCLWTALVAASESDDQLIDEALREMGFGTASAAFYWNDAPERTQAEVIARLRGEAVNS